jgi:hypothetical protein
VRKFKLGVAAALLAGAAAVVPAQAGENTPKLPPNRYAFERVDDGFMRLDNQTGQVAHCSQRQGAWICETVPEHRDALQEEVARLQSKIASLQKEIAQLRADPEPRPPKPVPDDSRAELTPPAPDVPPAHNKIARARAFIVNAWHHLMDMLANLQKDVTRKG